MRNLILIILIAITGCTTVPESQNSRLQHVVLCWLKDAGNADQCRQIIEVSRSFRKIPGVQDVHAGRMLASNSKVADNTFDVGIILSFANSKDLETYAAHPVHQKAKDEILLPLTKKIVVYDFKE